ncbi:zf-HC2 domain-containing protein [Saccharopolyspora dendranthemae]|uniref:Putative anti-sigma-YlaC factor YlaD n=1 Tax=Saccharopolyspora dendranthemae TaxID=1181886 RepID=A0A561V957_9PSEU|nr:zf-HC2 domain-containing protein [Saccharopolyspora dendranthemae]TWG08130.1 putative anti-sigma-YlaC factor YlaD [Saccharopolyspora dendranthemae]
MECSACRESLSARLDGEEPPATEAEVQQHLAGCGACADWERRAVALSREMRVRAVPATPDLSAAVMRALPAPAVRRWPRVLLGVVAALQIGLGVLQLLGTGGHEAMAGHLFHESTAWNLALGAGFGWAAWRVRAGAGMLPVLSAFLAVLTVISVHDLISGVVSAGRLASHLPLVAALVLLLVVRHDHRDSEPGPGHGVRPDEDAVITDEPDEPAPPRELGPTAYREAS